MGFNQSTNELIWNRGRKVRKVTKIVGVHRLAIAGFDHQKM